ncbi:hypothetical protein PAECIP111802_07051 [Paenibacillus allorhizosphaerae]|uniref:DUF4367 domain-containing protein n=2 Tax=Paenibacillus allorhizosphaerae TaxID=2849866 RepID=A0ABM8VU39_9BACL|nr:hypothetical protein PAECIP111802_07051 [Paenibacillus allorhizosphaerae]
MTDPPNKQIRNETNYSGERWSGSLRQLLDTIHPLRIRLAPGLQPKKIEVIYGFEPISTNQMLEMYQEAEETGATIVTRDLRKSSDLVGGSLYYLVKGRLVECRILVSQLASSTSRIHVPSIDEHEEEMLLVHQCPAAYLYDRHRHQLIWAEEKDGFCFQYDLREHQQLTKEEIVRFAQSLAF